MEKIDVVVAFMQSPAFKEFLFYQYIFMGLALAGCLGSCVSVFFIRKVEIDGLKRKLGLAEKGGVHWKGTRRYHIIGWDTVRYESKIVTVVIMAVDAFAMAINYFKIEYLRLAVDLVKAL